MTGTLIITNPTLHALLHVVMLTVPAALIACVLLRAAAISKCPTDRGGFYP